MSESADTERIVEAEIGPIDWSKVTFPKVDLKPLRQMTESTLLTGIGVGVLIARGVRQAVSAAYKAGSEEAERPGSMAETLVSLVRSSEASSEGRQESATVIRKVPMMPIADYASLTELEVIDRLGGLDKAQLGVVRSYEVAHANRPAILAAIDLRRENA